MRQTIKGVIIGAVVAAGLSVLLAQSPTWTTPRTWATDDLLTATQFNAQFRDNLLWLRRDAQLTGTDALLDLGCGTLGTNEVLFSDCTWATIPAGVVFDIHDDVGTAETIVDSDRMVFSDESGSGDPMRFTTAANLANYMQTEVELSADRVTSDTFSTARIPNLSASKITSGTFPTARFADNAVTPAKMDPESATEGQVMMIGSGGDPAWQFPFESPTTASGRAITPIAQNDHYYVTTSTINVGDTENQTVSVSAEFTVSDIVGEFGCRVAFLGWNGQFSIQGETSFTTNGAKTLTTTVTFSSTQRGSALPVSLLVRTRGPAPPSYCTIDASAMLTLTIP